MKDYSNNSNSFILNYTIEDNMIIVNMASGDKCEYLYSIDKEKEILEKMKKQVLHPDTYFYLIDQKERSKSAKFYSVYNSAFFMINVYAITFGHSSAPIISSLCAAWFLCESSRRIYNLLDSQSIIDDINKNMMFINNEEAIKSGLLTYYNRRIDTKTKNIVEPVEMKKITLNSMDKIKYKELKSLVKTIKKDIDEGSSYSELQDEKISQLIKKL